MTLFLNNFVCKYLPKVPFSGVAFGMVTSFLQNWSISELSTFYFSQKQQDESAPTFFRGLGETLYNLL